MTEIFSNMQNISDPALAVEELRQIWSHLGQIENVLFKNVPEGCERGNMQIFDRLYNYSGQLKSSVYYDDETRLQSEVYFHHREKAEIAFTVGSSWYGGDYFEFGSHDLATFRNMLSAYDICAMTRRYPDVRFYAFDIFGNPAANAPESEKNMLDEYRAAYFGPYTAQGDKIELHREYIRQHRLYVDRCFLMQGLFENTLTPAFKRQYKSEGREIGFAFLDCNILSSYKTVLEFIFDLMAENSHIYLDEYFHGANGLYDQFAQALREQRGIGSLYLRNAGGFGGLFRLYPLTHGSDVKLNFRVQE